GSFLIAESSVCKLLRKQNVEMFKRANLSVITIGADSAFVMLFTGHWQALSLVGSQPIKMAGAGMLWVVNGVPAPYTVSAAVNEAVKEYVVEVHIPYVLRCLSFNQFSGSLDGINDLQEQYEDKYGPGDYIPNVTLLFWVFRIMTGAGGVLLLLGFVGMFATRRGMLPKSNIYLKIMPFAIILPFIANTAGWLLTEMGRQPWVVFGLMKTEDAISHSVTANEMLFSLIAFT